MIKRRTSTVLNWLRYFDIIEERNGNIFLASLPHQVMVEDITNFPATDVQPILRPYNVQTQIARYPEPVRTGIVQRLVNEAALDRANQVHQQLTNNIAAKVLNKGYTPRFNKYIDLYSKIAGQDVIFEMKSCTQDNILHQVRNGISQLYEYRYLQNMNDASLVLVLESKPEGDRNWIINYLTTDRNICVCWLNNGVFEYPPECTILNSILL